MRKSGVAINYGMQIVNWLSFQGGFSLKEQFLKSANFKFSIKLKEIVKIKLVEMSQFQVNNNKQPSSEV